MTVLHSAPRFASNEGVADTLSAALGGMLVAAKEEHGEIVLIVARDRIEDALRLLRDAHDYQQLMEIAGADYPTRPERFDVVYMLLSLTRNHRVRVRVTASETTPVPTVTTLWPVAGWLEREVFDMYGVVFAGNPDLRRILTDYGFEGHPFRKDFPLTGYVELRYSEEDRRVVYEPVSLAQDFRSFDFMSPWEGADYVLPGDEKSAAPLPVARSETVPVAEPKTTEKSGDSGAGGKTDAKAEEKAGAAGEGASGGGGSKSGGGAPAAEAPPQPTPLTTARPEPGAPDPTSSRPDRPAEGNPSGGKQGAPSTTEGS